MSPGSPSSPEPGYPSTRDGHYPVPGQVGCPPGFSPLAVQHSCEDHWYSKILPVQAISPGLPRYQGCDQRRGGLYRLHRSVNVLINISLYFEQGSIKLREFSSISLSWLSGLDTSINHIMLYCIRVPFSSTMTRHVPP